MEREGKKRDKGNKVMVKEKYKRNNRSWVRNREEKYEKKLNRKEKVIEKGWKEK